MKALKIHSLGKGWCDRDYLILHAVFQILTDFVDKEDPFNHSPSWAKSKEGKITRELYKWWKKRKDLEDFFTTKQMKEDTEMLTKLIKVRLTLWT